MTMLFQAEEGDAELEIFAAVAPEVQFQVGADTLTLVYGAKAVVGFEREERFPIIEGVAHLGEVLDESATPQLTILASMLLAGMQAHHPRVTHEWCLRNVMKRHVLRAMFTAVLKAMPAVQDPGDERHFVADADPMPPAGAARGSGTGKRSSGTGSRRKGR